MPPRSRQEIHAAGVIAGALLGLVEGLRVVKSVGPNVALFLSIAFGAGVGGVAGILLGELAASRASRARVLGTVGCIALALGLVVGTLGSAGRRAAASAWRWPGVVGFALVVALAAAATILFWRARATRTGRADRLLHAGIVGVGVALTIVNGVIYPRSYAVLHLGLAVAAIAVATIGIDLLRVAWRISMPALAGVVALGVAAPFLAIRMPSAAFALASKSSSLGQLVARARRDREAVRVPVRPLSTLASTIDAAVAGPPTLDLRGKSVLLVTVDALRSDTRLRPGMPALEALAENGVAFDRVVTSTPATSHAIASLFTGQLPLAARPIATETVASALRRAGYRTAAFYSPAVFAVDGARYATLRATGFGFEEHVESELPAPNRVEQVRAFIASADRTKPWFVWTHLLEPHEPYDDPEHPMADARTRYDAEVRLVDRTLSTLAQLFREARPDGIVIVTADHGEEFGEHGGSFHGTTLHAEQVRVPLVWSFGTRPAELSARVTSPVSLIDVAPTLLRVLGVPATLRADGEDLTASMLGARSSTPRFSLLGTTWRIERAEDIAICPERGPCEVYAASDALEVENTALLGASSGPEARGEVRAFLGRVTSANLEGADSVLVRVENADEGGIEELVSPLVALLGDADSGVRARAARLCGARRISTARPTLGTLLSDDVDAVRVEAALALLAIGTGEGMSTIERALLDSATADALRTRAAIARAERLGVVGDPVRLRQTYAAIDRSMLDVLLACALDAEVGGAERRAAIRLLSVARGNADVRAGLESLLTDLALRAVAADALGVLADRRSTRALARGLSADPYPSSRCARLRALVALRAPGAQRAIREERARADACPEPPVFP